MSDSKKRAPRAPGSKRVQQTRLDASMTRAERIASVIEAVEKRLTEAQLKVTIADYIRLMQMQKEQEQQLPRHIEVTWVESTHEKNYSVE